MGFTPIDESEIAGPAPAVSGFTPISDDEIVAPAAGGAYDTTMGALKGIAKAGTDVLTAPADLLFRGANAAIDYVGGTNTDLKGWYPSDYRDSALEFLSGGDGSQGAEAVTHTLGNLASIVATPTQAGKIAEKIPILPGLLSKVIGYGAEGAGYSALLNAKSDTLGEDVAEGAALNVAIPAAFKLTGSLARGLSNTAESASKTLRLSAYGAGKARINAAIDRMPDVLDDAGKFKNPIGEALESFEKSGGATVGMSGEKLMGQLETQHDDLIGVLRRELEPAQALQTDPIIPSFSKTEEYVANLAGTNKAAGEKMAADEIAKTVNNTDGTLLSLQDEKVKLGRAIRDTAWGKDAESAMKVNILKRVRADLRESVEQNYASLTGKPAEVIGDLNKELGKRESLYPLFKDIISSGEARDPLKWLIQNWRTSGGFGSAALLAGSTMGPAAAAIPLIGGAAVTPSGRRVISSALKSGLVHKPLGAAATASKVLALTGRAASALADDSGDAQRPSNSTQIQLEQPTVNSLPNSRLKPEVTQAYKLDKKLPAQLLNKISQDPIDLAVMLMESAGDPKAKNKDSTASGLFQLLQKTAGNLKVKDVFDPEQNYKGYKKLREESKDLTGESPALVYAAHYLGEPVLRKAMNGEALTEKESAQVAALQEIHLPRFLEIYNSVIA